LGKLDIPDVFEQFIPQQILENEIEVLPISLKHLSLITSLPFYHRNPFDRLLIAQALTEGLPIVSADIVFDKYAVERRW